MIKRNKLTSCIVCSLNPEATKEDFNNSATHTKVSTLQKFVAEEIKFLLPENILFKNEGCWFIEDSATYLAQIIKASAESSEIEHLILINSTDAAKELFSGCSASPILIGLDFKLKTDMRGSNEPSEYASYDATIELYDSIKKKWKETAVIGITNFESETDDPKILHLKDKMRTLGDSIYSKNEIAKALPNILRDKIIIKLKSEIKEVRRENELLKTQINGRDEIFQEEIASYSDSVTMRNLDRKLIGSSIPLKKVKFYIEKYAKSNCSVFIQGESGTGKELVARAMHRCSKRCNKPFVAVNCAAIPSDMIESELFGHEKGAFTGAIESRRGKFEEAKGGTLFLDEIGDLSLNAQAKVLRAIQEKVITRVGSNKEISIDIRLLSATNKDLFREIEEGHFRDDLYHRLMPAFPVLPPLRDRKEDIPELIEFFKVQKGFELSFTEEAINLLMRCNWKGNIRELEKFLEQVNVLFSDVKKEIGKKEVQHILESFGENENKILKRTIDEAVEDCSEAEAFLDQIETILINHFQNSSKVTQSDIAPKFRAKTQIGISRREFITTYFAPNKSCIEKLRQDENRWRWPLAKAKCQFIKNAKA